MKKVNLMIGRFQPFTLGHYKCVEFAFRKKKLPTVVAMIDVPDEKADEKHPFPTSMLLPLYKEQFKRDDNVADFVMVKSADIVKIGETLKKEGYEIASWSCGTDRIDTYQKMSDKYHDQAGLAPEFEMLEIPRTGEDISATKVRQALLDNNPKEFYSMVPRVPMNMNMKLKVDYFTLLKDQIDKVYKK